MEKVQAVVFLLFVLIFTVIQGACSSSEERDCNWLLKVEETIPVMEDGLTIEYTLVLIAYKMGGKDVYGSYEGVAYIGSRMDASGLSGIFAKITGGFDTDIYVNNLSFELEPFDREEYARYGSSERHSLPPLADYDSMALLSPVMKGHTNLNPFIEIIGGFPGGYFDSGGGEASVAMKIAVNSGKVYVEIPSICNESFEGTITGSPKINEKKYQDEIKKLEEQMEKGVEERAKEKGDK